MWETSFPGLSCEDEGRDEKALVWAGQFCILIGQHQLLCVTFLRGAGLHKIDM